MNARQRRKMRAVRRSQARLRRQSASCLRAYSRLPLLEKVVIGLSLRLKAFLSRMPLRKWLSSTFPLRSTSSTGRSSGLSSP
jgi:hypothetical protein